jgi:hypothetical protein
VKQAGDYCAFIEDLSYSPLLFVELEIDNCSSIPNRMAINLLSMPLLCVIMLLLLHRETRNIQPSYEPTVFRRALSNCHCSESLSLCE